MESKKSIVFVGDSYCSSWSGPSVIPHKASQQFDADATHISWLDVATSALNLNLYSFGFSGRSWYYSRRQLFEQMTYDPDWIDTVDLLIFCHTDSARYNTGNADIGNEMLNLSYRPHESDPQYRHKMDLAESLHRWMTDLVDYPYQEWAQEQWFHEIARELKHVRQIHFNNFPFTVDKVSKILPGVVYTTPLVHISIGEGTGTDNEINKNFMANDTRVNHFSPYNNRALGQLIVDTAQNYRPGTYSIDTSKFEVNNPNAARWPNPGFGSC